MVSKQEVFRHIHMQLAQQGEQAAYPISSRNQAADSYCQSTKNLQKHQDIHFPNGTKSSNRCYLHNPPIFEYFAKLSAPCWPPGCTKSMQFTSQAPHRIKKVLQSCRRLRSILDFRDYSAASDRLKCSRICETDVIVCARCSTSLYRTLHHKVAKQLPSLYSLLLIAASCEILSGLRTMTFVPGELRSRALSTIDGEKVDLATEKDRIR